MRTPGELLTASPWAFAFRTLEPVPTHPRRLLVLLHGVDGDELQMAGLGSRVEDETHVVLPRGPRSIAGDRWGWFREGNVGDEMPEVVLEEAMDSRARLLEFIGQLQRRFDLDAAQTVIGGFSQGAMLCAGAALRAPDGQGGVAMLAGRIPVEFGRPERQAGRVQSLSVLIAHGRDDATVPVREARQAQRQWLARGADVELQLMAGAHALSAGMEAAFMDWWPRAVADSSARQVRSG